MSAAAADASVLPQDVKWDVRTSDLVHFKTHVSRCLKPYKFLSKAPGGHDAAMCRRRLSKLDFMLIGYSNGVTIDAGRLDRLPLLQIPLTGSYCVHSGRRSAVVPTRTAHLLPSDFPLVMEWSPDCLLLVVRLSPIAHSSNLAHRKLIETPQTPFGSFVPLTSPKGRSIGHLIDCLTTEAMTGNIFANDPSLSNRAEDVLLSMLANGLSDVHDIEARLPSPSHVRRAEQFILRHLFAEDLSAERVAAELGVAPRTLYRCFYNVHGRGPMAWARERRLDRARSALLASGARQTSVTEIAAAAGFNHFGRFAELYRQRFGELPSATLRTPGREIE